MVQAVVYPLLIHHAFRLPRAPRRRRRRPAHRAGHVPLLLPRPPREVDPGRPPSSCSSRRPPRGPASRCFLDPRRSLRRVALSGRRRDRGVARRGPLRTSTGSSSPCSTRNDPSAQPRRARERTGKRRCRYAVVPYRTAARAMPSGSDRATMGTAARWTLACCTLGGLHDCRSGLAPRRPPSSRRSPHAHHSSRQRPRRTPRRSRRRPATPSPWPGATWEHVSSPESIGWSSAKLKAADDYSRTISTEAVFVVVGGKVLTEWGQTTRKLKLHSIRKSSSFLGALRHRGRGEAHRPLEHARIAGHRRQRAIARRRGEEGDGA